MKFTSIALSTTLVCGYAKAGTFDGQGTPDGQVPPGKILDLCEKYEGNAKAKSLCRRYCYAQDCYSPDIHIVPTAVCDKVYQEFLALTGEEPICIKPCPCFDAATFADGNFYCTSVEEGSLFVKNDPNIGEPSGTIIAVAATVGVRTCTIVKGIFSVGQVDSILAGALSQIQAETCLGVLLNSGCQPFA